MGKSVLLKRRKASVGNATPLKGDGSDSTEPANLSMDTIKRVAWLRRAGTLLLFVFVIAGALSVFGVNEDRVSASGGGYELAVEYSSVSRPGLETPWVVSVTRQGGFDGPVELRTTADYFDLFDFNQFYPEPAGMRRDGEYVVTEFDPPEGNELMVSLDAKLSPATQNGTDARTAVLVDGSPVVEVSYRTRVMP